MIIKENVGQIIVGALFSINITLKKLVKCLWNICNETQRIQWRKTLQMHCVNWYHAIKVRPPNLTDVQYTVMYFQLQ